MPTSSNYLISHFEAAPLHAFTKIGLDPGLLGECLQQQASIDFLLAFASCISVLDRTEKERLRALVKVVEVCTLSIRS